jgi:hypothetical protein
MSKSSGPFTDKKARPHSVATALASMVLPVPGGPYNKMLLFLVMLNLWVFVHLFVGTKVRKAKKIYLRILSLFCSFYFNFFSLTASRVTFQLFP